MTDLFAARSLIAFSLGFHILFALTGMAMPLLMVLAERRWLSGGDPADLVLARRWAKGTVQCLRKLGAVEHVPGGVRPSAVSDRPCETWRAVERGTSPSTRRNEVTR